MRWRITVFLVGLALMPACDRALSESSSDASGTTSAALLASDASSTPPGSITPGTTTPGATTPGTTTPGATTPPKSDPQHLPPPPRWVLPTDENGRTLTVAERKAKAQAQLEAYRKSQRQTFDDSSHLDEPEVLERMLAKIRDRSYPDSRKTAIFLLGDHPRPGTIEVLEATLADADVDVATAAATKLYRWHHKRERMFQHLVQFARRGALAGNAFLIKQVRGRRIWNADAPRFFSEAVRSSVPLVRTNAAVHLLELDIPEPALRALRRVLQNPANRWSERVDAVTALKDVVYRPDVRALLRVAVDDVHPRVRHFAQKILSDYEAERGTP